MFRTGRFLLLYSDFKSLKITSFRNLVSSFWSRAFIRCFVKREQTTVSQCPTSNSVPHQIGTWNRPPVATCLKGIIDLSLTQTLIIPMFFTQQNMITILYQNFGEKNKFFPLHFHLYVGTGMRAVCRFCTGLKNQKNSWGYPSKNSWLFNEICIVRDRQIFRQSEKTANHYSIDVLY